MHRTRVGVLRGGPSAEYQVSLNTGANVLRALREKFDHKYHPLDIFIDQEGVWHIDGLPISPHEVTHRVDVLFNALHGTYGEDGQVQALLESHRVPFTGSDRLASAVSMNKLMTKEILFKHDIKTPYWKSIPSREVHSDAPAVAMQLFRSFVLPAVIKPNSSGSSVGVSIVRSFDQLVPALVLAATHGDTVLVEEFIPGTEATVGTIEGFRGEDLYVLPVVEIRPHNTFFDYQAKYAGQSQEIVPASFTDTIKDRLGSLAKSVHRVLGLRHYSRSDFIVHPRRGIYVLEVNTLPGLTDESLVPKSLRAIGSDTHEFVDHVIGLAIKSGL